VVGSGGKFVLASIFHGVICHFHSLKCPVTAHWRCLSSTQREEILKAARDKDRAAWHSAQPHSELLNDDGQSKVSNGEPGKRSGLDAYQTTEFICGMGFGLFSFQFSSNSTGMFRGLHEGRDMHWVYGGRPRARYF
jgi:hypothetical protein